jgi:hypothetical protein
MASVKITASTPVMLTMCNTCPFRDDGYMELRSSVEAKLLEKSQLCHAPRHKGKRETHICRGARDTQLKYFHRIGFLSEPTDDAWQAKLNEVNDHG